MVYLVTYDLKRPGQEYTRLHEAIEALGIWWHYLESTWLVDTSLGASGVWEHLKRTIDRNDSLLIIAVSRDYSGWLTEDAWQWIQQRVRAAA